MPKLSVQKVGPEPSGQGKWKGMHNGQPSRAQAQRALHSGYVDPSCRKDCCARCAHFKISVRERRVAWVFCTLHRHRIHKMGICPNYERSLT
jgi:hypothetical protein